MKRFLKIVDSTGRDCDLANTRKIPFSEAQIFYINTLNEMFKELIPEMEAEHNFGYLRVAITNGEFGKPAIIGFTGEV